MLKAQEDLTRQSLRLSHLQELETNLEGIGSASRSLALYLKDQKGNMTPMIADQIKVPQLLERAVEAALGDSLETIVVNQYSEVQDLLAYLKESSDMEAKNARVRFFVRDALPKLQDSGFGGMEIPSDTLAPVDSFYSEAPGPDNLVSFATQTPETVRPSMTMERYLREHTAVVGNLNELLSNGGQVAEWASLYSNWWVVRDRTAFENLRPSIDGSITLVSLDGDVSHPNGFMDYAPVEESPEYGRHLVQRRRELEELKASTEVKAIELQELQSSVETLKKSLSVEKEAYKLLTQRLVALNPGLQKHTDLIRELEAQVARLGEKKENLAREFDQNSEKLENLKLQLEDRNTLLIEKTELRRGCEESLTEAQARLAQVELRIKEKAAELEVGQKLYSDV
jgi:chromosome segregation ATPase